GFAGAFLHELVPASPVKRIVECGAAAGTQHAHAVGEASGVVSEILRDLGGGVEADDEGLVITWADDLVQKLDSGLLLELKAVANGVAGIDEQANPQREVGLAAEIHDGFWRLIVVQD